jgi:hypothetical protein
LKKASQPERLLSAHVIVYASLGGFIIGTKLSTPDLISFNRHNNFADDLDSKPEDGEDWREIA